MKRLSRVLAACALAALLAGCGEAPAVFEDVGLGNPHPPAIQLLSVTLASPAQTEDTAGAGAPAQAPAVAARDAAARTVYFDTGGLTVRPGANTIVLNLRYSDVGGDVAKFQLRDRDSGFSDSAGPELSLPEPGEGETLPTPKYFPGSSGTVTWELDPIKDVQQGPHRLEVWAEDSQESRSEKVEFTVNVVLF